MIKNIFGCLGVLVMSGIALGLMYILALMIAQASLVARAESLMYDYRMKEIEIVKNENNPKLIDIYKAEQSHILDNMCNLTFEPPIIPTDEIIDFMDKHPCPDIEVTR